MVSAWKNNNKKNKRKKPRNSWMQVIKTGKKREEN